jgi:hypothetical protein
MSEINTAIKREGSNVFVITAISLGSKVREGLGELLDACLVAMGSAMVSWLDEVSDGWGGIMFPNQYMVRNDVVGKGVVSVSGDRLTCTVSLRCDALGADACGEGRINSLVNALNLALRDAVEGRLARHVVNYGRKLVNIGEDVEVTLFGGGIVKGEAVGYGARGELVVATQTGIVKVKPSKVARIKRLWP